MDKKIFEKNNRISKTLGFVCIFLTIIDSILTFIGINWGFAGEGNPIQKFWINLMGLGYAQIWYVLLISFFIFSLYKLSQKADILNRLTPYVFAIRIVLLFFVIIQWILVF